MDLQYSCCITLNIINSLLTASVTSEHMHLVVINQLFYAEFTFNAQLFIQTYISFLHLSKVCGKKLDVDVSRR